MFVSNFTAKGINHVCAASNECRKPLLCLINSCKCPIDKYWDGFNCFSSKISSNLAMYIFN